jgi:hypothetical protein
MEEVPMFTRPFAGTLVVLLACAPGEAADNELRHGGGYCESEGFWISGLNLCLRRDTPGVAFGMVRPPRGDAAYAYLVLIKGDEKRRHFPDYGSRVETDGKTATDTFHLGINGTRVDVRYGATIDPRDVTKLGETLTINGKPVDVRAGRVLLVDLSGAEPRWQQVRVALPARPAVVETLDELESRARAHVRRLRQESEVVRRFLK